MAQRKHICGNKNTTTPKGLGPLEEWHLASDCVRHLHEKNLAAKRPRKPVSNTATNIAIRSSKAASSTMEPTKGTKHKRADIDYKQYHSDGTMSVKSPKTSQKPLPKASGPSADRLAAQEYISQEK